MAEKRKIEQYKIYTLHSNRLVVLGKNEDKQEVTRTDRVAIAVFDDKKALETYKEKSAYPKAHQGYEVVEDWIEFEPKADRFSLPLNPKPVVPEKDEAKEKDNGDN